ncbi:SMI1/KNR4 family protein [Corynebacterium auriscanis]|uniref:Knr4/Smi1-like domain-containing protein n=1 Tax=Corynebacterium auriscanis TaxID=99807 RepID=A0A0A2DLP9_9CORY|nr:SMI1/KNR4 family protein [Corynebacterium auriscanis]KGM18702.1 hypothetical protein MA47_05760 [Corynebacterium auriscanis]WJY73728.1 SMI1 / KNR4 family protein [Corynebacterium auriscanis]
MRLPQITLLYPGEPCNGGRIRAIERKIKRKLPDDYAEFVKTTGGGVVSFKNCVLDNVNLPSGMEFDSKLDRIFGNGTTTNGSDNDLVDYAGFLTEEWEIPKGVLLIGCAESGMHECFVINYELREFPPHSVLYLDNESDDGFVLVADSFSDFLSKLRPDPDYKESERSPYRGHEGIQAAREGELGEILKKVIASSSLPDMEPVLRKAIEPLASGDSIKMYVHEDSFKFQDLLFYLAQTAENYYSLEDWSIPQDEGPRFCIYELLGYSFMTPSGWSAVSYFDAALIGWWESRTKLGVLVETPHGYKLKDDYIASLVSMFRQPF